ncbi:MAG: hypothetical protein ACXW48_21940 [Candidatus Binatia bacterium]
MAKQRVGYALGYGKFTNVREMAEVMQQAEERGFEWRFFPRPSNSCATR